MAPSAPIPAPCACLWRRVALDAAEENARLHAEVERLQGVLEGKTVLVGDGVRFIQMTRGKA